MKCIINVPKLALYLVTAFAALHAALKGLPPELELIARAVLTVTWGSKARFLLDLSKGSTANMKGVSDRDICAAHLGTLKFCRVESWSL